MARPIIRMAERLCSMAACDRESYAKGLCRPHYERMRRGYAMDGPIRGHGGHRPEPEPVRFCSVAGCDREHRAKGFCDAHYTRVSRDQSLDRPLGLFYGAG